MSDYLWEEIVVEIFTRLPPKSLPRFKSLSKSLCSIISTPSFIRMHTFRSPEKLLIRHQTFDKGLHVDEDFCTLHAQGQLPLCPERRYIGVTVVKFPQGYSNIIGSSCNGILCLFDKDTNNISLWNPSIWRKLTLPDCPRRCLSYKEIGFGFDPITDDYKIVSISNPKFGRIPETSFVYSMKTGAWSAIASPIPSDCYVKSKACFVDGTLHWVVRRYYDTPYILTFDLSSHVFGMIAMPALSRKTRQLINIDGYLAVMSIEDDDSWIWVRRDDSWSVYYNSEINQAHGSDIQLLLTKNGDLSFNTYSEGLQEEGTVRVVGFNASSRMVNMLLYAESLQLLDMGTASDLSLTEKGEEK